MGRRTGVSSDETRKDLLDSALRVLLERGYGGTRVSEIAREAGVTAGSIYNHFDSKSELITAAITERAPNLIGDIMFGTDSASTVEALRKVGSVLDTNSRVIGPLLLEFVVTARQDREVAEVVVDEFSKGEARIGEFVRSAQDEGEFNPLLDSEALARLTSMIIFGSYVVGALELKPVDSEAWSGVFDRLLASLTPRSPHSDTLRDDA